jgi:hypothetical protein
MDYIHINSEEINSLRNPDAVISNVNILPQESLSTLNVMYPIHPGGHNTNQFFEIDVSPRILPTYGKTLVILTPCQNYTHRSHTALSFLLFLR